MESSFKDDANFKPLYTLHITPTHTNEKPYTHTYTRVNMRLFMTPIMCLFYMYGTQSVREYVLCIAIRPLSPDKRKFKFAQIQRFIFYTHEMVSTYGGCASI